MDYIERSMLGKVKLPSLMAEFKTPVIDSIFGNLKKRIYIAIESRTR
jgi:hypothetical protein